MLTHKAQTAGIQVLAASISQAEEHLRRAEAGLDDGNRVKVTAYYNEATKWHCRAAAILNFIDGITSDGPLVFSELEYNRVTEARQRAAACLTRLNRLFTYVSQ